MITKRIFPAIKIVGIFSFLLFAAWPAFAASSSKGHNLGLLFIFLGGIATSLSPCVYPLIPITVSVFGARESKSILGGFILSLIYVLGIAMTYSILGVLSAYFGFIFGSFMSNPIVVWSIFLLFFIFALSLFGLYEIRLPISLQQKLNKVGGKGYGGAFMMGLVAGFIAAPCTGPVLGSVLTFIATSRDIFLGFIYMFTFSMGMGLLFIVVGTFSVSLPKAGKWTELIHSILGVIILAAGLYFLKNVFQPLDDIFVKSYQYLIAGIFVVIVALLLNLLIHREHLTLKSLLLTPLSVSFDWNRSKKILLVADALFLSIGLFMIVGFFAGRSIHTGSEEIVWIDNEQKAIELAKSQNRPLMIDFYATWCTACKELDEKTFSDPEVKKELKRRFITARIDCTNWNEKIDKLSKKYEFSGLPYVAFFDSSGKYLKDLSLNGFIEPKDFLKLITKIK